MDPVQLLLQLGHFLTGGTYVQVITGPGGGNAADGGGSIDIHIASIIVMDDFNGGITLVSQILGTPLAQPFAGYPSAITVAGEDGLSYTGPGKIVGKNRIHQIADIFKNISPVDPFLIVCRGRSDGEIVALVPVPFRIWFRVESEKLY